jgi:glucokinase
LGSTCSAEEKVSLECAGFSSFANLCVFATWRENGSRKGASVLELFRQVTQPSTNELVCAVDLGGTNLRAANIDSSGRLHERVKFPTPVSDKAEDVVAAITSAIEHCEGEAAKRDARMEAVSVVVPGSVHAQTRAIVNAPNIPAIVDYELAEALETKLQRPVLLENDANAAALGEMWQGAARGSRTIVCLTLGTGVGSGIILNGELWRGIDGTAGEAGHTSVDPFGGVKCECGNYGCLEVCASATAIVRMTREALPQHSASRLNSVASADLTAREVADAAALGDELANEIFYRMGTYLGIACANIVNTLNPEMIVIGGGVSASFDLFAQTAREEMARRAFPVPAARCQIVKGECGDDAGLLGAAWLAFGVR